MGTRPRSKPERLAAKLLQIRQGVGLSQSRLARLLDFTIKRCVPRVSEFEHGVREPDLSLLLRYARLIGVPVDVLIEDKLNLPERIELKRVTKMRLARKVQTLHDKSTFLTTIRAKLF